MPALDASMRRWTSICNAGPHCPLGLTVFLLELSDAVARVGLKERRLLAFSSELSTAGVGAGVNGRWLVAFLLELSSSEAQTLAEAVSPGYDGVSIPELSTADAPLIVRLPDGGDTTSNCASCKLVLWLTSLSSEPTGSVDTVLNCSSTIAVPTVSSTSVRYDACGITPDDGKSNRALMSCLSLSSNTLTAWRN